MSVRGAAEAAMMLRGNCWLWAFWFALRWDKELVVLSWAGGIPHFGVALDERHILHFRHKRPMKRRLRLPLWFRGELVCCRVKGDWARRDINQVWPWHGRFVAQLARIAPLRAAPRRYQPRCGQTT